MSGRLAGSNWGLVELLSCCLILETEKNHERYIVIYWASLSIFQSRTFRTQFCCLFNCSCTIAVPSVADVCVLLYFGIVLCFAFIVLFLFCVFVLLGLEACFICSYLSTAY